MADPICRWRNSSIKQLIEFNSIFPLLPTEKSQGRDYVEKNWKLFGGNNFFTTPYQLAAQMGVYYENESFMFPRFHKLITIDEASLYLQYWGKNYYAPNPYTKSIQQEKSVVINKFLVNWAKDKGVTASFSEALNEMFSSEIGNTDILINMLNNFSEVQIKDDIVSLKDASTARYADSDVWLEVDQNDKEEFFRFVCKDKFVCHKISDTLQKPLQQIYFGAPGTGKSHEIKDRIKKHKSFRITFHPDTDYSSFVGAYKPTSVEVPMLTPLGDKAIPMKDVDGNELTENKIIYTYVKQAFLNAYIEAWKERENETPQPVFLVIEEINRGNCAQIFGDIFQLLDRNDAGFSDYAVVPDTDLSRHVKKDLEKLVIADREKINAIYEECEADMVDKVLKGEVLLLPNNLYIWATMNTSDQSLFPIDSAFKRRWDWKYIKIADAQKNWQIKVGTKNYDWWQFVQAINYFVFDATQSEDKNLGYFFAKAKNGIISAETFVSKVIFYLYTDVFKDYGFSGDIFKGANGEEMTFQSFYNADGSANEVQIACFIENVIYSDALPETLKVANTTEDEDMNVYDEDEAVDNRQSSNRDKFMVNGVGSYGKCLAPFEAVKAYSKQNPQMNAAEIVQVWSNLNVNHMPHLVETEQEFEERAKTTKDVKFRVKAKRLELPNGEVIYVSNQFNPIRIAELIEKLNKANLGVNISLIDA